MRDLPPPPFGDIRKPSRISPLGLALRPLGGTHQGGGDTLWTSPPASLLLFASGPRDGGHLQRNSKSVAESPCARKQVLIRLRVPLSPFSFLLRYRSSSAPYTSYGRISQGGFYQPGATH